MLFVALDGYAQTNNNIVIGKIDTIYSATLHEKRRIWVHLPGNGTAPFFNSQRYPVIYLLDGDAHFASVMGMIQQLSEINGNALCPQMILVGIPNTDRMRDLTPTHSGSNAYVDSNAIRTAGGGESFTTFLEKELIPHIDSLYPTAPYRMLIGHSLGGLMVINTLIHHQYLFNAYLAIDPSLWWDNQKLLHQAETTLGRERFNGRSLFLAVANTMQPGMDTAHVHADTAASTWHIRSILDFVGTLKRNKDNGLHWNYKYYDEDGHSSVPLIAEYDALRYLFNYYNLPSINRFFDSSYTAEQAVSTITQHYQEISRQMGYTVLPPEFTVNGLGYAFLQRKMPEKAEAFFKLNISNYPRSNNAFDSMGDFYNTTGDRKKAIECYTKALSIGEYADTRRKLENLKAEK